MSVILAMGLAACGGTKSSGQPEPSKSADPSSQVTPSSSSATPSSTTPAPSSSSSAAPSSSSSARPSSSSSSSAPSSSSSSAPSSSSSSSVEPSSSSLPPDPVAAVTVSGLALVKKENNVFLQINGTAENIAAADFLWALALEHTGAASGGDSQEGFILGAATFGDEDYVLPATLNNDGSFVFEYDLSGLDTFVAGSYFISAAVKDYGAVTIGSNKPDIEVLDANYRFYFRNDISNKLTVCADELPPLALTEASIVKDDGKIWAKIGGEVSSEAITQDVLDGYDTFIQFQSVENGWGTTKKSKADGGYYWKLEGKKAFLYADVTFFQVNYNYNTHLNVKSNTQANCKMDVSIDEHYNIEKEDGVWVDYEVFSDLTASGSDQSKFWGNLGFRVKAGKDPSVHYHEYSETPDVTTPAGDNYIATEAYNCTGDCNTSVLRWSALDFDVTKSTERSTAAPEGNRQSGKAIRFSSTPNYDGGDVTKLGCHIVYNVKIAADVTNVGLAFLTTARSEVSNVFNKVEGDSSKGYEYVNEELVRPASRYGLKIDGEVVILGESNETFNGTTWYQFPVTIASLTAGIHEIEIYNLGGYRVDMFNFQLTGLPKVTPAA